MKSAKVKAGRLSFSQLPTKPATSTFLASSFRPFMFHLIHIIIASPHPVVLWLDVLLFADYNLHQLSLCLSTHSGRCIRLLNRCSAV